MQFYINSSSKIFVVIILNITNGDLNRVIFLNMLCSYRFLTCVNDNTRNFVNLLMYQSYVCLK